MMPFKKTCLWQVQDSAITMYLKRNFWAPPHQKTLLPLWLYHCNNRSFKKSKALETKGDVSDRHSLQVTCESMYYVLNTHLTILAQQMGLQVQAFAVYLL